MQSGQTGFVRKTISAVLDAPPATVAELLRDLEQYPKWLDLVADVETTAATEGDVGPAWLVTLRAKVGPFARSKRLRMVRVTNQPDHLRFERAEVDGRDHASWVLAAQLSKTQPCMVDVELSYSGGLWSTPLESILGSQTSDAIERLKALAE